MTAKGSGRLVLSEQGEKCTTCGLRRYESPFCSNGFHRDAESIIRELESTLARERESRKQAADKAFNAGIEAALNVTAYYADTRDHESVLGNWMESAARQIHERIRALSKPVQEPAERERGK
jgi:hypothetical protein